MKLPRSVIGKRATVIWRDPCNASVKSHDLAGHSDVPRGTQILATQEEECVIEDITDGVVRLRHTLGRDSVLVPDPSHDVTCTWVQEAVIESIVVYEPSRTLPMGGADDQSGAATE